MICTLGLGPFRGQYSAPAGRNGFFKRRGISPAGVQPESPYPIAWNIRRHGWSEYLYLTLRTPALGTELQMCTHGVRVRWTDRTHASPNSLFRAANTQLATRESQLSAHSSTQELEFKASNQRLSNEIFKLKC